MNRIEAVDISIDKLYKFSGVMRGTFDALYDDQDDFVLHMLVEQDDAHKSTLIQNLYGEYFNLNISSSSPSGHAITLTKYRGWASRITQILQIIPDDEKLIKIRDDINKKSEVLRSSMKQSYANSRRYTIDIAFKQASDLLGIHHITDTFVKFKRLLDGVYAEMSGQTRKELPLYLCSVYEGSFGLQFATGQDDSIIGDSMDSAIGAVVEGISIASLGTDKDTYDFFGGAISNPKVMKKYADLFEFIAKGENDINISWTGLYKSEKSALITYRRAKRIGEIISSIDMTRQENVTLTGRFRGIDLDGQKVSFVGSTCGRVKASFTKPLEDIVRNMLDKQCEATFIKTISYNEEHDDFRDSYKLESIERSGTVAIFESVIEDSDIQ